MKISQVISLLRGFMKEHSDDTRYSDEELYAMFAMGSSELMYDKLKKHYYVDDHNRHTFCIGLEEALSHECGCVKVGCPVLKSVHKIPKFISGRNTSTLKVITLEGIPIDRIDERDLDIIKTNDIADTKLYFSIVNQRIVLWNTEMLKKPLKAIQASALWENITDWSSIQYCPDSTNGGTSTCVDILDQDISIDNSLVRMAFIKALELLRIPQSLTEDLTNDAQGEIKV